MSSNLNASGFEGKEIQLETFFPNRETPIGNKFVATVGEGFEFTDLDQQDIPGVNPVDTHIDFSANSIIFDFLESAPFTRFASATFTAYVFTDVSETIPKISNVTIDETVTTLGLDSSDITFTEDRIEVNVEGLRFNTDTIAKLDVEFDVDNTNSGKISGIKWDDKNGDGIRNNVPGSSSIVNTKDNPSGLTPDQIDVQLVPGNDLSFDVIVTVPTTSTSLPLDLVLLQDLSTSFGNDLNTIRESELIPDLVSSVLSIQTDTAFGITSFIDKPLNDNSDIYVYKTDLPLTTNQETFKSTFDELEIPRNDSDNSDQPESQLEALMQLALRETEVGFRSNTRRVVLLTTDVNYNIAGDGSRKSITEANNGDNVLDGSPPGSGEDYPDIEQVKSALIAANIVPIFAVTSDQINTYQNLVNQLGFGAVEELTSNSSNLVDVISSGLDRAFQEIVMVAEGDDFSYIQNITPTSYLDVPQGETRTFTVTLATDSTTVIPDNLTLKALGFGETEVNISTSLEPGLAGVEIYLDLNKNGVLDTDEPITITATDDPNTTEDETGYYEFINLSAGNYVVREVVPKDYVQTSPEEDFYQISLETNETVTNINFGNQIDEAIDVIFGKPNNQARSKGEPHLTTFDGIGYDFQGAGEFTLVESLDDDLNIQVRYVQINNNVTVASAVATEVDGKNVVIDSEGIEFVDENGNPVTEGGIPQVNRRLSGGEAKVIIDGVEVDIASGGTIEVGNSRVYRSSGEQYTVVYAGEDGVLNDGDDQLVVNYFRPGTINIVDVYLGDEKKGQITGLLGNLNDNRDDDIALRDGTVLPRPLEFDRLYGDYRDDYRIKDISESLFTYEEGQNPDTFYNSNFPEAPFTYTDLDPEAKARGDAAALAAGYTPGTFEFESAAFDFAVTNDPGFLEGRETDPEVQQSLDIIDDGNNGGEAPTIDDATFTLDENSTFGTEVGIITANDLQNEALTFALTSGNLDSDNDNNLAFAIDPLTGVITVNDSDDLDFEKNPSFNLEVTATDPGNSSTAANITVNLADKPSTQIDTESNNGIFTLNGGDSTNVKFTLSNNDTEKVNEVGVFLVDDENGNIDGNAPGSEGYLKAALQRAQVIFSAISNRPSGFDLGDIERVLEVDGDTRLGFYLISDGTTDTALAELEANGTTNLPIFFSDSSNLQVSDLVAEGFDLNWSDEAGSTDFTNLDLSVQLTQDTPNPATELQGNLQNELIDLSNETGQVSVSVEVHREAAFDNLIGFYQVADTNGGIDTNNDGVVDLNPGDAGYEEAALTNRVTGLDLLQTDNQQTTTFDGNFDGGSILASFMVVDGTVDEAINNNAEVYFSFLGANSDGVDHIRLLGDNTFGYEDLAGGGDFDYNDMIVKVNFPTV